jgi:hypothetical protein
MHTPNISPFPTLKIMENVVFVFLGPCTYSWVPESWLMGTSVVSQYSFVSDFGTELSSTVFGFSNFGWQYIILVKVIGQIVDHIGSKKEIVEVKILLFRVKYT